MDEMGSELEFELERLIGENPEVVSENGHVEESIHQSLSPMAANSCNGLNMGQFLIGESNEISDPSLTSALEKLSLGEKERAWRSLQNHPILTGCSNNRQSLNNEASMVAVPSSLTSSNHLAGVGLQNTLSSRPVSDSFKKWQVGQYQPFEVPSPAMTFIHGEPDLNVPAPNLQFPLTSHNQQILQQRGQSPVGYIHPQQKNQGQIDWNFSQEPLYNYKTQEQYPYLHHLHDPRLECLNLVQPRGDITSMMQFQSPKQQYFEVPVSCHLEHSNHEAFWKGSANRRCSSQSSPVYSTRHVDTIQGLEKLSRQSFPRKLLTRTHGQNRNDWIKATDAIESREYYISQNGAVCSSCYVKQNGLSPSINCYCHQNLMFIDLYSDFRNRKIHPEMLLQKYNSLDEVTGSIYLIAKDQYGCRFLQRKFEEGTQKDIEKIFNEIIDHVVELMTNSFGNYLIQKLLEVCDEDQRLLILYKITRRPGELIRLSCDSHGTRVIQKVIETLKTPEQFSMIISSLKNGIVFLMKDINGNHVAQHCLDYLVPDHIEFLYDAATKCCIEVATDRHGCCVLQKCLARSDGRTRESLIREIVRNALVLSQDQYGNYVIQFILELSLPWAKLQILKELDSNYANLSVQKYSSNVVEKCMHAREEHLPKIVDELINDARLCQIMQSPFGNYAIQAALNRSRVVNGSLHARLVDAIKPYTPVLRTNLYGRKVLAVLGRMNE